MLVTMATPISSHVKDKNSIFTRWGYDFLVKEKILVFHQYLSIYKKFICFRLQYAVFIFLNRHRLKTWFELSRVKLYGNYLQQKFPRVSGIVRFESVRVKIQNMYVGNPGVISRLWFEVSGVNCTETENGYWKISKDLRGTSCYCFPLKINVVAVGSQLNFGQFFLFPFERGGGGVVK